MDQTRHEPRLPSLRLAALILLGAAVIALGPFLYHTVRCGPSCWGFHDWPQFWAWYDLPRVALVQYGQLGFWNPYVLGGVPGFAHTHDPTFSPVFLMVLAFGTETGTRLVVVLWTYLAMLSMFALARRFGVGGLGCYLAAVVWGLNGHHMLHLLVGHIEHAAMGSLPLVVLLFLRERCWRTATLAGPLSQRSILPRQRRQHRYVNPCEGKGGVDLFLTALVVAGLILAGAVYPAGCAALLLALLALWLAVLERRATWLGRLVLVALGTGFLAAVKLVAAVPFVMTRVSPARDPSGTGLAFLWGRLISPAWPWTLRTFGPHTLGFWEFGAYVGVAVVALFVVGLIVVAARRGRSPCPAARFLRPACLAALLLTSAVFLLLSFGSRGPVNLFGLLRHVPVLGSMHVPFRFVAVPLMMVALLAGMGLDWLVRLTGKRRQTPAVGADQCVRPPPGRTRRCAPTAAGVGRAVRIAAVAVIVAVGADLALAYRHLVPAAFAIDAIDVAAGTAAATDRGRLPGHRGATGAMPIANVGPASDVLFQQRRVGRTAGLEPASRHDHYVIQPFSAARYLMQLQNRGDVAGYEMLRLGTAALWVGHRHYRGEAYLQNGRGRARLARFSPSRFTVEVDATDDDVLILNQNVTGGWHVTMDGKHARVTTGRSLVSAEVPAGRRTVVFWFRPDGFWVGVAVSVGSLLAVPIRILVVRRRKKGVGPPP